MQVAVAYGRQSLALDVPETRVVGTLKPKPVNAVGDVAAAVERAVARPHQSEPLDRILAGKDSALIVTVDHTRPSPRELILPVLTACHRHGLSCSIMIATGRHRQMTSEELDAHLGTERCGAERVLQHDAFDEKAMVTRGRTRRGTSITVHKAIFEHDVVIGVGFLEPSYLAGFSGGRKLLMPGLAHHESIDNNHFFLSDPGTRIGRLAGNPVSEDAAEFASQLPLHFIVYAVVGPDDEVVEVVAGDPVAAHASACERSAGIFTVDRLCADIVISSAGGWPYDCDLVQGKKAVIPATETVNPGGAIILCAECPDGLGAEQTFLEWLTRKSPADVARDILDRAQFNLGAHGANILAKPIVGKEAAVILVTRAPIAGQLKGSYVTCAGSLQDAWRLANARVGSVGKVLFIERARRLIIR
ncbi:MAG: nickel-dependent lactate racemase [Kiritimatiellae bacterium]|nr:nickel-dependent lactate racemase [Kiritimatiellia bacterium]